MAQRTITEVLGKPDVALEMTLRPSLFSEFTGQAKVKERLEIAVAAAKQRREAIDHVLLCGPPGLGKTTLAHILAKAMGANLKSTSGPTIEKAGDLAGLLTNLEEGDVLFIDEIHRLQKTIEEYLYPAMEDFKLDIIIDQGPNARSVRLNLPRFTLIGATTRSGLLTAPLLNRFPIRERLDYYQADQLEQIVTRSARLLNVEIQGNAALEIARRSRGTPRIANNLLRRVRDYAQVKHQGRITPEVADKALVMLESIKAAWTKWTSASSRPSLSSSPAAPLASAPSPWPWAKNPTRSRRSMSPTLSWRAISNALPRAGSRPNWAIRKLDANPAPPASPTCCSQGD